MKGVSSAHLAAWLRSHGGAVGEFDFDAQKDFMETFLRPALAAAWDEGHDSARSFYSGGPRVPNPFDGTRGPFE